MKPLIAITQRVAEVAAYSERRDALDQRWHQLFALAHLQILLLPNHSEMALELLLRLKPQGLVLSGGNSLSKYGGDAPERDKTEKNLITAYVLPNKIPVLAVCRGMQVLLDYFDQILVEVHGHVANQQTILFDERAIDVNSYQTWGRYDAPPDFKIRARAQDGVVKAVSHDRLPLHGIMWHPERIEPFRKQDIDMLKELFHS